MDDPSHTETSTAGDAPAPTGADVIAILVRRLPNAPGVYRMIDRAGDVLYVGKARNLRKRVANYTRPDQPSRLARMVSETATMEFVQTRSETEALLLEANLIKRLRPRFNVLMRDDKSFPYILVAEDHQAPPILKHRGARKRPGAYFGPFASAGAVGRTVNALQKAFLLRTCPDSVYASRTRPCLLHQIKRCSAPCTHVIGLADYRRLVDEAKAFLSGRSQAVKAELASAMEAASGALDFERAAIYRDRIAALSHVQGHQGINPQGVEEADVFALHAHGGQICIQVFFFRTGQNWGNRAYFPKADKSVPEAEVLESFLAQFYDDKPSPRLVLLSHEVEHQDILAAALSERAERRVEVATPKRGEKRDLVEHARLNAREALARRLAETTSQGKLLIALADAFGLAAAPRRIEVFDNSHVMGSSPVGAMIVAGADGFVKNAYRKFNIRSEDLVPGDDYGMMREVLCRRFARLMKEAPRPAPPADEAGTMQAAAPLAGQTEGDSGGADDGADAGALPAWPDLVLVDGGVGQLAAAEAVLADLGVFDLPVVGVAKGPDRDAGRETFFMAGRTPFRLEPRDPVLYFVQRLRDEAHRFAIGSHRARRAKAVAHSTLDEIPGVGPTRKRALLHHFGTMKAVGRAATADLARVPGISAQLAEAIHDFFHDGGRGT